MSAPESTDSPDGLTPDGLTPGGRRLAQHYARTMDLVDRCVRAAEEGNWVFLSDEAGALSAAADELAAAASYVTTEERATSPQALKTTAYRQAVPRE